MNAVFFVLVTTLIGISQGRHEAQNYKAGFRQLDLDDYTPPQDGLADDKNSCAKSDQVKEVENLINNSVHTILYRIDQLDHKPENVQRSNNFQWESVLRKELNDLRQEMTQCCANSKALESKIVKEIESLISPIGKEQTGLKSEVSQAVRSVSRLADKGQKQVEKLIEEWEAAIAGFQASQMKFKMEMEQQAQKFSDLKNCVVDPKGFRQLDLDDYTPPQDGLAEDKNSCAKPDQVKEVENSVNTILYRLDQLDCKPENVQRSNNFQWESVLRKELNDLRQEMMQCCANSKALESKILKDIESLIAPIGKEQTGLKSEVTQVVRSVSRLADRGQKQLGKLMEEWEAAIAGFQASQMKFKMEMELQAQKLSDLNNCVVDPNVKKIHRDIGEHEYKLTQAPVSDQKLSKKHR